MMDKLGKLLDENTYSLGPTPQENAAIVDKSSARHTTAWIVCVYTSILSFLFHLPSVLVPDARPTKSPEHTEFFGPVTTRIYKSYVYVQRTIALVRVSSHLVICFLLWSVIADVKAYRDPGQGTLVYATEVWRAIYASWAGHIAFYILCGSIGLWIVGMGHMYIHLIRLAMHTPDANEIILPKGLYSFCHIDPINFVFQVPAWGVPAGAFMSILIFLVSVSMGIYYTVTVTTEENQILCWGCFKLGISIYDLNYGWCSSCPLLTEEDITPPSCDQANTLCGEGKELWDNIYSYTLSVMEQVLVVAFLVHFVYLRKRRIDHYNEYRESKL